METQEPEVQSLVMNGEDVVAEVRIVRACADCSAELKEAMLTAEAPCPLEDCRCEDGSDGWEVEGDAELVEEGGGRYRKSFYGFKMEATVKCPACNSSATVTLEEKVAASQMEVLA
jgi:hypothetical protein